MKGYFRREDLTRKTVVGGWFMTGDIGLIDDRGRLVLRGRERDEINKGGMKIFPSDIDSVVERFDRVTDVCAFPMDDPIYGQNVGMAVVLSDPGHEAIRALHHWMKKHLAEPKMPVRWWLIEEIPRTSRGKVNRDAVKAACVGLPPMDLSAILRKGAGQ
jgi:fatty-acyl-CoA synthase/2,3-dihydroxybenzoate-AMP ligase